MNGPGPDASSRATEPRPRSPVAQSPPALAHLVGVPTYRDRPATLAHDVSGVDLDGRPVALPVSAGGRWTLLLFLSSGCGGCGEVWRSLAPGAPDGPAGDELVVAVTRDAAEEDVPALRSLAPPGLQVVMSSAAWRAYRVAGPPFFVLADGQGVADGVGTVVPTVVTEGVVVGLTQVVEDVRRARARARARGTGHRRTGE